MSIPLICRQRPFGRGTCRMIRAGARSEDTPFGLFSVSSLLRLSAGLRDRLTGCSRGAGFRSRGAGTAVADPAAAAAAAATAAATAARNVLRQFYDETIGIGDMHGPVTPRPVGGPAEDGRAQGRDSLRVAVHVIDGKYDLGRRPRRDRASRQSLRAPPLVEGET